MLGLITDSGDAELLWDDFYVDAPGLVLLIIFPMLLIIKTFGVVRKSLCDIIPMKILVVILLVGVELGEIYVLE